MCLSPSEVATRIIYLLNQERSIFSIDTVQQNANTVKLSLPYLLQIARGALLKKRTVHVGTLVNVLTHFNVDYQYYKELSISAEFRKSLQPSLRNDLYNVACLAPWCASYKKCGSLVPTGTSLKRYSDGSTLRKHVACTVCGSRYAFDTDGNLVNRDHFLKG
ncbi:hypothetical protein D3C76_1339460 [compost metagenome]